MLSSFFASNACFARDKPSSKRVGSVGLSRKSPKLLLWRCTQPRAAKTTATGIAVVGKMASITRAILLSGDTRSWRAELGVSHADLRREATAVTAKAASALLHDTAVWYLVWVCGCEGVCFVVG